MWWVYSLLEQILKGVQAAACFTIITGEATGSSYTEQLWIVVQYLDTSNIIKEEFLEFVSC